MSLCKKPEELYPEENDSAEGGCFWIALLIVAICAAAIWVADWVVNLPIFK